MVTRTLYVARHGEADAWGALTDRGRKQSSLLGDRLAERGVPVDVVWHSPLPRAAESARLVGERLPQVLVDEAPELIDHVPFVPARESLSSSWVGFFDGYGPHEVAAGEEAARALTARFGPAAPFGKKSTVEVLITHAYPAAWLVREALGTPPTRWISLAGVANTALTILTLTEGEIPVIATFNDQSHLPAALRWTGFPRGPLP